jgi:hypothetical protein
MFWLSYRLFAVFTVTDRALKIRRGGFSLAVFLLDWLLDWPLANSGGGNDFSFVGNSLRRHHALGVGIGRVRYGRGSG